MEKLQKELQKNIILLLRESSNEFKSIFQDKINELKSKIKDLE